MGLRTSASSLLSMKMVAIAFLAFVWGFAGSGMIISTESFQTTPTTPTTSRKNLLPIGRGLERSSLQSPTTMRRNKVVDINTNNNRNSNKRNDPSLYLFGRNKEGDSNNENDNNDDNDADEKKKSSSSIPFFGRLKNLALKNSDEQQQADADVDVDVSPSNTATVTATATPVTATPTTTPPREEIIKKKDPPSPDDLLAMAKRARLESEKLDAELTLSKIEKLEKKLMKTTKVNSDLSSSSTDNKNTVDDLQYQLDVLQAKLRGEPAPVKVVTSQAQSSSSSSTATAMDITNPTVRDLFVDEDIDDSMVIEAANKLAGDENDNYDFTTVEDLEKIPNFLLKILAAFVGMDINNIDKKEFLKRWEMTRNLDYSSFTNKTAPVFTSMDIQRKKREILDSGNSTTNTNMMEQFETNDMLVVTKIMLEKSEGNATQLALYALENDYYLEMGGNMLTTVPLADITPDFVKGLLNESYFGSMYPKCVTSRGEGESDDYVSEEPTLAQIDVLTKTILPAIKFSSSAKPTKVAGGYAITGSHKFDNGDDLIEAIDKEIYKSRPNLMEQITVLYTPSYGPLNNFSLGGESLDSLSNNMENIIDQDTLEMFANQEPILYITGPDIVRKSNRLGLTLASIFGLATSWYLAVYPFLLNDQIASKVDADLKLVEANLQPDMSYLTDLTVPLFLSFIGLQLVHEAAHRLVAMSKGVKLSVPVFVPSFITGITSTVTTFKTLPKNKNDMFDISAAGPLAGIVFSSIALAIGTKLTLISDPSTLPALPLDILRQSTLGGAIIDNLITGLLYIPEGASSAGINIPLHPLAIAGYTSLLVNALALLPIGTSDGGRLTMALFDRAEKMSIGSLTLAVLLYAGLFGSDMFLFYFSFCLAFQTGNEVPARNEQDSVNFSRVIVAIACYGLATLILVPIQ